MSSALHDLGSIRRPMSIRRNGWPVWPRGPYGSETAWLVAFVIPYAAVFLAFAVYPLCVGLWIGRDLSLYADLFSHPRYLTTVVNTLLMAGLGVNLQMFMGLLLSGFFIQRSRWIKALLVLFMLPWALPALPAYISMHWMLIGYGGFMNSALEELFGIDGPIWFNSYWLAMGANVVAYVWKWMPFWTLVFLAGRMAIPDDIYDAAAVDGATGIRRFAFVTFPLLANLYLISTLLFTLWTIGDFTTAFFVTSGAPALMTETLATFGFRVAFQNGYPALGLAATLSALPVLIPIAILLIRRLHSTEVQL